jgi:hypothetical protein
LRRLKNYAIINYSTKEEAENAIACMHRAQIDGLFVTVKFEEQEEEEQKPSQTELKKSKPIQKEEKVVVKEVKKGASKEKKEK